MFKTKTYQTTTYETKFSKNVPNYNVEKCINYSARSFSVPNYNTKMYETKCSKMFQTTT